MLLAMTTSDGISALETLTLSDVYIVLRQLLFSSSAAYEMKLSN